MKKFALLFAIFMLLFCGYNNFAFAEENYFYVITDKATLISKANSEIFDIICELNYNEQVVVLSEKIKDPNSSLEFYQVRYKEQVGYILSTSISNKSSDFKYAFVPNAKLSKNSVVYTLLNQNFEELVVSGKKIELEKNCDIKVINKYQKNKTYTQISFQNNGEILSGYVLTDNIKVSGFNYYWLIAIFVVVIVLSTIVPIIIKNKKKRKKDNQLIDKISTSPHKTSK